MKKKLKNISWPEWPIYYKEEKKKIKEVLHTSILFNGNETRKLEFEFAKYNKSKYVCAVGNATQGLHLALAALNIGIGDEVIVTNYSWISTASCILMQNAIPIFADIETKTLSLDVSKIEKKINSKTKAIIYVHMFGYIADIESIRRIAKKNMLKLVEDASHSHGASYKNIKAGNFGDISVLSMQQRKNLPCGDGGLVVCKNKKLFRKVYNLRSFGSNELSYNYRISELSAGIARIRLKRLDNENKSRNKIVRKIKDRLKNIKGLITMEPIKHSYPVYYKLIFFYDYNFFREDLDFFIKKMNSIKIPVYKTYLPLNLHPNFNLPYVPSRGTTWLKPFTKKKFFKKMNELILPISKEISFKKAFQINIPPYLKILHINYFIKSLEKYVSDYKK
jgi:perosamine synthetase